MAGNAQQTAQHICTDPAELQEDTRSVVEHTRTIWSRKRRQLNQPRGRAGFGKDPAEKVAAARRTDVSSRKSYLSGVAGVSHSAGFSSKLRTYAPGASGRGKYLPTKEDERALSMGISISTSSRRLPAIPVSIAGFVVGMWILLPSEMIGSSFPHTSLLCASGSR